MIKDPLVSIIIPTLNSAKILGDCLQSIREQTYPNIEVIVVDGHSCDMTQEISKQYCATVFTYGEKQDKPFGTFFGAPFQRNFGASKAQGEFIYYVDSDMRLTPGVVQEAVKKVQSDNADAVIVPEFSYGNGFWSRCRVLEKSCYYNDRYTDAARFIRASVWKNLGGLDASLGGGDDWDFQHRLNENGFKTVYIQSHIRHFEGRLSLRKQLKKKFIYGKTVDKYFVKHSKHPVLLFKQYIPLKPAFLKNWRLLLRNPITALGLLILKVLESLAALLGLAIDKSRLLLK